MFVYFLSITFYLRVNVPSILLYLMKNLLETMIESEDINKVFFK